MSVKKIVYFTTDEHGRSVLQKFQEDPSVEISEHECGEVVRNGKKEPAVWVTYMPMSTPGYDLPNTPPVDNGTDNKRKQPVCKQGKNNKSKA